MVKELHFVRVRHKDTSDPFCDPMADIKVVVAQAFAEAPHLYEKVFGDKDKAAYLKAILKVLLTRMEEDPAPLDEQLKTFEDVFEEYFTKEEKTLLIDSFAKYIFFAFALHYRRDASVDNNQRSAVRAASALLTLRQLLDSKTYEEMKEQLRGAKEHMENTTITVNSVDAVCVEKDLVLKDIKDTACILIGEAGDKWEEIASACDQYVVNATDTDKAVSVALAYPDYNTPYFEVGAGE